MAITERDYMQYQPKNLWCETLNEPLGATNYQYDLTGDFKQNGTIKNSHINDALPPANNSYLDFIRLPDYSSAIKNVSLFSPSLEKYDSKDDLLKQFLKTASKITQSKTGSIFLNHTREKNLKKPSKTASFIAVKDAPGNKADYLFSQNPFVAPDSSLLPMTEAYNGSSQKNPADSQECMVIPIEDAKTNWGKLYLHGKMSGEKYHVEDFLNVSLATKKVVDKLNRINSMNCEKKEHQDFKLGEVPDRLQEQSNFFAKSLPVFMLVIDDQYRILGASGKYKNTLGRKDNILSDRIFDEPFWDNLKKDVQDKFKEAINKGHMFLSDHLISMETPENTHFFITKMLPIPGKEELPQSKLYLIVLEDIGTQEKIWKRFLDQENQSVMALLAAGIAHDLNNPLDGLNRLVKIIENEIGNRVESEYFKMIYSTVERMSNTIKGFLKWSKIGMEKTESSCKTAPISLNQILDETIHIMLPKLSDKNIHVKKSYRSGRIDIPVSTDIYNVFINIINNAFDAMGDQGVIEIEILDNPDQKHVDVVFRDNGEGIPEVIIENVMKPFFSTKKDGTGLGLTLCNKIVATCGGTINIKNRKESGCEVTVSLPVD